MGKNRLKKLRNIIVGNIEYKWLVENTVCGINIKIWDNKKNVIFDDLIRLITEVREVTPEFVKKIIIDIDWIETKNSKFV